MRTGRRCLAALVALLAAGWMLGYPPTPGPRGKAPDRARGAAEGAAPRHALLVGCTKYPCLSKRPMQIAAHASDCMGRITRGPGGAGPRRRGRALDLTGAA